MDSGDPFRLIEVLRRHDVPLVIIGGHAVAYHGFVRATEDIDIVFRRSTEAETRLLAALSEVHAQWIGDEIDPATGIERTHDVSPSYLRGARLMMLITDFGFLDIFDYVPGLPGANVSELFDTAETRDGVHFASLQWVRTMKAAANRPKDRTDLENLPDDE